MRFYCRCLNVTVDVLDVEDKRETLTRLLPVDLCEEWNEYSRLAEQGTHVVWQSLFQTVVMRDAKLHRCLSCNQHTHVTAMESNRILVNRDLLDETTVVNAYRDPNYSPIVKIVLPTVSNQPLLVGSQDKSFQREYELVQQLYRRTLDDADRETEEKIRLFQQEQEQLLKTRTQGINRELDTFLNFLRSVPRQASMAKPPSTSHPPLSYLNDSSMESGFGSDIFDNVATDLSRKSSTVENASPERASNLDDVNNDDSLLDNTGWFTSEDPPTVMAASVPRNIAVRPGPIPQEVSDENDDLERIGKSFRELSRSLMCTDGTELFGDLPSPPLNAR